MRLLITGAWNASEQQIKKLETMGQEVVYHQYEKDDLPVAPDTVEGVICNGLFLHHPIEQFTSLKFIQLTSAGFDRVPMDHIQEKGIRIYNARGVYSTPMAEFALSGVLQLYKKSRFFWENQKKCRWEKHRGLQELAGKQVCILGCGSVGTACAKRFQAFDCHVTGIDKILCENRFFDRVLPMEELDTQLKDADIVVLCLPFTEETRHLVDERRLAAMKQGAILVNIARGQIVDTKALIPALEKHLGGAVLDVFEEEPLAEDSPLWQMENVILTPHNSFVGDGNAERLSRIIMENLENYE